MPKAALILVAGPSGAGKDTLLDAARERLTDDPSILFAQRVITRPADAGGEGHQAATEEEFDRLAADGAFSLSWAAHGLKYGIPREYEVERDAGRRVVANVSRGVIGDASARLAPVKSILITAAPDILAARLAARKRESAADIERRLRRETPALPDDPHLTIVDNGGALEDGVAAFLKALEA